MMLAIASLTHKPTCATASRSRRCCAANDSTALRAAARLAGSLSTRNSRLSVGEVIGPVFTRVITMHLGGRSARAASMPFVFIEPPPPLHHRRAATLGVIIVDIPEGLAG